MPYSALIWLHILPIPFHCYCHTNCIHIASLCTVYLSTRVYNYCFMKLCFIRCRKELWKTIYIVFCIDSCSYLYWCSLFLSVNLNYCLVSFHLSLKLSLLLLLAGQFFWQWILCFCLSEDVLSSLLIWGIALLEIGFSVCSLFPFSTFYCPTAFWPPFLFVCFLMINQFLVLLRSLICIESLFSCCFKNSVFWFLTVWWYV